MTYRYLRNRHEYEDSYDRMTVEKCLRYEESHTTVMDERDDAPKQYKTMSPYILKVLLWIVTGERFRTKQETIEKWMQQDRKRDEMVDQAVPPKKVLCRDCGIYMCFESKHLHSEFSKNKERVLFMMRCEECRKGKAVFDDGSEWKCPQPECPDCKEEMQSKHGQVKDRLTTEYTCPTCCYGECTWLDMDKKEDEPSDEKIRRYRIDHDRFCLSDKDGREYIDQQDRMKQVFALMKDSEGKEKDWGLHKKARELKKLSVKAVEKKLSISLRKSKYEKIRFREPQVGKDVIVEFTIQDSNEERGEYDSKQKLKKAIQKALSETNWRLMSEGVDYRLGVLSGRLRGYESEEDLVKLLNVRRKADPVQ